MANIERGIMRLMRIANHPVEVVEVRDFSSLYRRIRFSGPEMLGQLAREPARHLGRQRHLLEQLAHLRITLGLRAHAVDAHLGAQ